MVDLKDADLSVLVAGLAAATSTVIASRLAEQGHPLVRPSHGYLIQHLIEGPVGTSELGRRMGISKQAASKAVRELAEREIVEYGADRTVGLTDTGRALVAAARDIRAQLDAELADAVGAGALQRCRRTLAALIESVGGAEDLRSRRLRIT